MFLNIYPTLQEIISWFRFPKSEASISRTVFSDQLATPNVTALWIFACEKSTCAQKVSQKCPKKVSQKVSQKCHKKCPKKCPKNVPKNVPKNLNPKDCSEIIPSVGNSNIQTSPRCEYLWNFNLPPPYTQEVGEAECELQFFFFFHFHWNTNAKVTPTWNVF